MNAGRWAALAPAVAAVLAISACSPAPDRGAVDDSVLFDQIAALEGVDDLSIGVQTGWDTGTRYSGTLIVAPEADALCALEQAYGILRYGSDIATHLIASQGDVYFTATDFLNGQSSDERFGPRPSDAADEAVVPACTSTEDLERSGSRPAGRPSQQASQPSTAPAATRPASRT